MMRRWIVSGVIVLAMVCVGGGAAWAQNGGGLRAITLEDLFAIHPVEGAQMGTGGEVGGVYGDDVVAGEG